MKTYEVRCVRRSGATCSVREIKFLIDADSEDQAKSIADARLARMRDFDAPELDIDSIWEMAS